MKRDSATGRMLRLGDSETNGAGAARMDEASLRMCVRITARLSALVFAASMIARTVEVWRARRGRPPLQFGSRLFLVGLLVSHTIHFSFVAGLAWATHGANIAERHGWIATGAVALFFYALVGGVLVAGRRATRGRLAFEWVAMMLVTAAFLVPYVGRVRVDPFFVPFVVLLSGAAIAHSIALSVLSIGVSVKRVRALDE